MATVKPIPVEVLQRIDIADLVAMGVRRGDCLEWSGSRLVSGYGRLKVCGRAYKVHRLAWALVHGDTDALVLHHCDNRPCFRIDHLFDGSPNDNVHDMVTKGRNKTGWYDRRGANNPNTKFTEGDVLAIRARLAAGETRGSIARHLGVVVTSISNIANGVTWAHLVSNH